MGSNVPAGVAAPGTTATDTAAVGAPTTKAPATGVAITGEAVGAAETQAGRGRPAWALPAVAGLAVVGLASWTLANWGMEETDNAQLQAEITQISSRVAGTIERVAAERDQAVAAGTPLVQHPDRPRQLPWPSRQVPGLAVHGAGLGCPSSRRSNALAAARSLNCSAHAATNSLPPQR